MANYEAFFREADTDGSGTLSMDELVSVLRRKGYKEDNRKIYTMFRQVDTSGDGLITLEEFMVAMRAQPPKSHKTAAMRNTFIQFDKDGNGQIDKSELQQVFQEIGKSFTDAEIQQMIQIADADGSGTLDYEEFIAQVFGK